MEEYAKGNVEFLKMSESGQFDLAIAERLLAETKDINYPICDLNGYSTTYLYEAARDNNLEAVHFLLNHGANPNTYVPDLISECPIWDMMYIDDDQDA